MSGEAIALLLLLGASVGLASNIAAVTSLALIAGATLAASVTPLVDTSVLAVLIILFALFSAWRLFAQRSSPASQKAAPPNSILVALGCLFGDVKAAPPNSIIIRALHGLFGGVLRQLRSSWCLGAIAQGGSDE